MLPLLATLLTSGIKKNRDNQTRPSMILFLTVPLRVRYRVPRTLVAGFIHLNRESVLGWGWLRGRRRLVSSVSTGTTAGHGSVSRIVIMVQSVVIMSLSFWFVEEYLNNKYLGEYLNGLFQADGLVIGMLGTLLVLGSISSLMFLKRRHGEKKFGAVSLEVTSTSPKINLAAEPKAKPPEIFSKPNTDFHPVVAALKADMADRRMSFSPMLASSNERPTTSLAPNLEVRKTSVLDQLAPNRQPPMTGPRPGQVGPTLPQQPLRDVRPPTPTGSRIDQAAGLLVQRPLPVLSSQQPVGSSVLQSTPPAVAQIPTNVTTVITGILPVKKKDPAAGAEEKSSSSQ